MSGNGGMCSRPFGVRWVEDKYVDGDMKPAHWESNPRFDKTDDLLKTILSGGTEHEYGLWVTALFKLIQCYKYWALGSGNHITDEQWQDAHEYLFLIRSNDPSTWGPRRLSYLDELPDGRRMRVRKTRSDDEMRKLCFDVHYSWLRLDRVWPLEKFLRLLQEERKEVLTTNWDQVEAVFADERRSQFCRTFPGAHIPLSFEVHDLIEVLTNPKNIEQVARAVFFPTPNPTHRVDARALRSSCRGPRCAPMRKVKAGGLPFHEESSDRGFDFVSERLA